MVHRHYDNLSEIKRLFPKDPKLNKNNFANLNSNKDFDQPNLEVVHKK